MKKRIALLAACCLCLMAEVSAPQIGFVRTISGELRPLRGVAGAFVLGDAIETEITQASFNGDQGCAVTRDAVVLVREGKVSERRALDDEQPCPTSQTAVEVEGDEVVIRATGVRLRTPLAVETVERISDEWYVLRTVTKLFVLRTLPGREAIYELPEAV